ncbi:hypothetical protein TL16_g09387 [Triparma laevis f. inornata]|uniref:Uncharacterized protein n=1 Tax=Triparma laevis f. inornata TaxID=1714386 RepID=A0A9W7B2Q9_9STRA|nr:hypothetical protein TL16_g09387 [Triparma laevis f. inornata]
MGGKRGAGDERKEDGEGNFEVPPAESLMIFTVVSIVPATTNQFMFTDDFKRLLVGLVMGSTLMRLWLTTKAWKRLVDAFIDEGVTSGAIIVHSGNDIKKKVSLARKEKMKLVTRVIFNLNIAAIGRSACCFAVNLVIVEIPEGVATIGRTTFNRCTSLTTVSFPTTLTSIGKYTFYECSRLDNVNLRPTNLQELDDYAFHGCLELKSMTIPDSLQTFAKGVFWFCPKLVPANIDVGRYDTTPKVVAYLRSLQRSSQN